MFESKTPESIRTSILGRMEASGLIQTREGSFASDLAAAVSLEISEFYHQLDMLLPAFYLSEGSGSYIDKQAAIVGITRKPGTLAHCTITFTGSDGALIPAGMPFYTATGLTFLLEADTVLAGGSAQGSLAAEAVGSAWNIGPGEIVNTLKNVPGVSGYTNREASGGTDPETDGSLLGRYLLRMQRTPTSGNPWHYQMWAREVPGVGAARVVSKWSGPGTVQVILADANLEPPDSEIVKEADAHIQAERPVGPAVTVVAAGAQPIAIQAAVTIDGTTSLPEVRARVETTVRAYLQELASQVFADNIDLELETLEGKTYTILYNRIAFLLLSVPGVVDYASLTVNGGTGNLVVAADQLPQLQEVTIT